MRARETAVDRTEESGAVDLVRKAVMDPHAQAYLSADRLHGEVRRLQARLAQVRKRGGAFGKVDFSEDVRDLLGRLEAGATLSQYVH
jgi:hypothetical protein